MKCKLCNHERPLIDAHVIPRSIYEEVKDSRDSHLIIVQNKDNTYPKMSRIGHYDPKILCSTCDGFLGRYDEYGKSFIFDIEKNGVPIMSTDGRLIAYKLLNHDYRKLKLFFLSILWRASVSKLQYFSRIKLGFYEEQIRRLLLTENPGPPDLFPVYLSRFTGVDLRLTMIDPIDVRLDGGVRLWLLYLIACNAYIKVDRRELTSFKSIALAPDRPLFVVLRDFTSSKEAGIFESIAERVRNSST